MTKLNTLASKFDRDHDGKLRGAEFQIYLKAKAKLLKKNNSAGKSDTQTTQKKDSNEKLLQRFRTTMGRTEDGKRVYYDKLEKSYVIQEGPNTVTTMTKKNANIYVDYYGNSYALQRSVFKKV